MAMCVLHGLCEGNGVLNIDKIFKYLDMWVKSNPFDMGITIQRALKKKLFEFGSNTCKRTFTRVFLLNQGSQSNGCLMRITPLAVWGYRLSKEDLYKAVLYETRLTHCNEVAIEACQLYCYAISLIMNGEEDRIKVYDMVKADSHYTKDWFDELEKDILHNP